MNYIIDRIEGLFAVCEDESRNMVKFLLEILPVGIKEGDCLTQDDGIFIISKDETEAKRERIKRKMSDLFE